MLLQHAQASHNDRREFQCHTKVWAPDTRVLAWVIAEVLVEKLPLGL